MTLNDEVPRPSQFVCTPNRGISSLNVDPAADESLAKVRGRGLVGIGYLQLGSSATASNVSISCIATT